jgi:hypothetical protein
MIDQTRQRSSLADANNMSDAARIIQAKEYEAKKSLQPTDQGCQFDTTARYMSRSTQASDAAENGYAVDFNRMGNNDKDVPGASSAAATDQLRLQSYKKFCDASTDGGNAGCPAANPKANMHILPSRTIFARETIDLADADTRDAVTQLMFNITGFQTPDPMVGGAQKSAAGIQARQEGREYLAQMDAVGSLVYGVVAERSPGEPAPEVQAMRQAAGALDASPNPSAREIRQAVIEQLWDQNYYNDLYDSPETITQKEIYLKAYSLVMLYDMIGKQEKISTAYAIETANMLNSMNGSSHNVSTSAPLP